MKKAKHTGKIHIKKGDKVEVIAGAYKGSQGEVLEVFPAKYRVVVDGVNVNRKHTKPTHDQPGGINEINSPIHISNVALLDPKSGETTRIGRKIVDGKSVRFAKKSGEIIN